MDDRAANRDYKEFPDNFLRYRNRILLSFMCSSSAALLISYFIGSVVNNTRFILFFILTTGIFFIFQSVKNRKDFSFTDSEGGLSLLLEIIFVGLSVTAIFSGTAEFYLAASAAGLILLFMIDNSFSLNLKRTKFFLHGGQVFLTGLMMISFLSDLMIPFLFISAIKLVSGIYYLLKYKANLSVSGIRFLRIMLLLISGFCLVTRIAYPDYLIIFLFFYGELIERILYYHDFDSGYGFAEINQITNTVHNETEGN